MLIDAIVSVIIRADKILLIERGTKTPFAGWWGPVSGKIEPKESPEDAVARESLEEVGLTVHPIRKVWENVSSSGRYRLHWWLAEYVSGELALDAREASDARWLRVEETTRMKIFEGDREFYEKVLPTLTKERCP
jgi:8-oxo-dGTP diphosphatase